MAAAIAAEAQSPIQVSGTLQTDYSLVNPSTAGNSLASLGMVDQSGMRLSEATLSVNGDWNKIGFHVDGGAGDFYTLAMAADSLRGVNQYISQAYLFGKTTALGVPVRWEVGKFFSSVGAEVAPSSQNFNISRSLLFWYGEPLYHIGVQATAQLTQRFSAGAQLLSGSNTITGSRGRQSVALTTAWTEKKWSLTEVYLDGDQKLEGNGARHLSDTIVTVSPTAKVTGYVEALAAIEKRNTAGYDHWYGFAGAFKFSPVEKWSFSPRLEWYNDPDGATTGVRQRMAEFTLTGEYRMAKWAAARAEYRNEFSNVPFYQQGNGSSLQRDRQVFLAGITLFAHFTKEP